MPRVHAQRANKDYPEHGIKKGTTYYWWKFRRGGKRMSAKPPKPSQLTQSEFWGAVYGLQEDYETAPAFDDIEGQIDEIKTRLEEIRDEQEEKRSNMEDKFPNGCPSMELLQERYDALDEAVNTLDGIDIEFEEPDEKPDDYDEDAAKAEKAEGIWQEVTDALSNISCS